MKLITHTIITGLLAILIPFSTVYAEAAMVIQENQFMVIYAVLALILAIILFIRAKVRFNTKSEIGLGFLSITPHRPQKFFPIDETVQNMVPVVEALADDQTNVYSNLNKITLSMKSNGVYLEDKNYKISILVNRRRSRRSFLNDGDILDMGELTIMFKSPDKRASKFDAKDQPSGHIIPRARRVNGKIIKNTPKLVPVEPREKTYYITKNLTLIGHSEMNDLIPKSKAVSPMHSRIERISGKYKLIDLSSPTGTFVNGRRIDTKILRDGDEISFESVKYTFSMSDKA
ncbi:FHA domain-containing protein [bacterium]|nr:FHA domain-containing protein [bacterium]